MDGNLTLPNWMEYYARPSLRTGVVQLAALLPLANARTAAIQANEMHLGRWVYAQRSDRDSIEQVTRTSATGGADMWILAASSRKWMTVPMNTRRQ
jgi:hypothetical protein